MDASARPSDTAEPATAPLVPPAIEPEAGPVTVVPGTAVLAPAPDQPRPRSWWSAHARWALAVLVLLAVGAAGFARFWFGPLAPAVRVAQRDFVQTVVASGQVQSPHRVDVGAQVTGTVAQVPVEEGQVVEAGTPLVLLDAREAQAGVAQADLAVAQAQARVRQLRELDEPTAAQAVRQARVNHENAARTLRRNRDLLAQGFIGQATVDETARAEEVARAQLRTAEQQLAAARAGGSAEATALAALRAAEAGAEGARARLAYTAVRAPVAGTLISRNVERGDVVQPGKVLMVLSPAGGMQLVLQIDEKNLRLLAMGQPALASADAYPDQRFAARVAYINPGIDAQRGAVEVKLDVPEPPAYLRQDMTVSVDIEVARRPHTLVLPADAVHEPDGAAPWVLKLEGGRAHRTPVRLGLRSSTWCEVLDGLRAGDVVLQPGNGAVVADGARVRPSVQDR